MNPTSTAAPSSADTALLDRIVWRVMPVIAACYIVGTIDRSNIGFAKLTMAGDLHMSDAVFALGSSLFYLGYFFLEVPSALAAHRYGARKWFTRIMVTWGLATLLLAFTVNIPMFYCLRFLLGAAEAGLYPGLLYCITIWLPKSHHARAMGFLTIGSAVGNSFGALCSGPLLALEGVAGLHGWQWIFLVTGAMPMLSGVYLLLRLDDRPEKARFLSEPEKRRLVALIEADTPETQARRTSLAIILDPQVLAYGFAYAVILTALYGVIYWAPTMVKSLGVGPAQNGLMVAFPWAIDAVLLLTLPRRLNTPRRVLNTFIVLCLLCVGASALGVLVQNPVLRYCALLVGIPCISLVIALFWTFPARLFRGAQAAAALGAVSMFGNLGGLVGQNIMPAVAKLGGEPAAALWVPCVCLGLVLIVALLRRARHTESDAAADLAEPA